MNILGIDYGRKRVGLSFAHGDLGVAVPIDPIVNHNGQELFEAIGNITRERRVAEIVVGYPLHMDGKAGRRTQEVDEFVNGLKKRLGLPVHKFDERLSTSRVKADFRAFGKKTSRKSGQIDSGAATLILQDFLEQREWGSGNPGPVDNEEET